MLSLRTSDATAFTIGHSNLSFAAFAALLERHRVAVVADVRSAPYSRFNPQFNREALADRLGARGLGYLYLGGALGGRPNDPACYDKGRIRYDRVTATKRFQDGVERVVREAQARRLALMCAEKEPLDCHRTLLIAPALTERGVEVAHILADGELERQDCALDRLLAKFNLQPDGDLFRERQPLAALLEEAIALQAGRVAYVDGSLATDLGRER